MRNIWYFVAARWHFHPWCPCVTHCVTGCICYSVQMGVNGGIVNFLMENVKLRLIFFFCWQNELGMKKTFLKAQLTSALQYAQSTTFFIYINRSDQHPHANKRSQLSNYQKLKLQQGLKYRLNFNSNKLLVWAFDTCSNLTNTWTNFDKSM